MKFDEHSELPTDADYIVVENVQDVTLYDVLEGENGQGI